MIHKLRVSEGRSRAGLAALQGCKRRHDRWAPRRTPIFIIDLPSFASGWADPTRRSPGTGWSSKLNPGDPISRSALERLACGVAAKRLDKASSNAAASTV